MSETKKSKEQVLKWANLRHYDSPISDFCDRVYELSEQQMLLLGLDPNNYEWLGSRWGPVYLVPIKDENLRWARAKKYFLHYAWWSWLLSLPGQSCPQHPFFYERVGIELSFMLPLGFIAILRFTKRPLNAVGYPDSPIGYWGPRCIITAAMELKD